MIGGQTWSKLGWEESQPQIKVIIQNTCTFFDNADPLTCGVRGPGCSPNWFAPPFVCIDAMVWTRACSASKTPLSEYELLRVRIDSVVILCPLVPSNVIHSLHCTLQSAFRCNCGLGESNELWWLVIRVSTRNRSCRRIVCRFVMKNATCISLFFGSHIGI